jgi:gamma-glutamyl-gamma-aminobutyrate hydrolase PuuD
LTTRPIIGITTYVTPAKWGYWELEAALIPHDYVRAVEQAGGRTLLVPPSEDGIEETLEAVDAPSRRSRIRRIDSRWACSGIRRRAKT